MNESHTLLGGLSPQTFMRRVWQKEARLIRQAVAGFQGVVTPADVLKLATRDDLHARLIIREGKSWHIETGPFSAKALKTLPAKNWTILVQDLNTVVPEADALMRRFSFIPYARLDDVMVSLAAPGGGVGPHFDQYDVFLLQGQGRRRWRIGQQSDLTLRDDLPLKILKKFQPTQEWTLDPGDMLYLPPKFAHDGVAVDTCLTFSIGFRAPTPAEILGAAFDFALDNLQENAHVVTRALSATDTPAHIPAQYVETFARAITTHRWQRDDIEKIAGVFASTPKAHVVFDPPESSLRMADFKRALNRSGARFAPATIALYDGRWMFVNGEAFEIAPQIVSMFDCRVLRAGAILDEYAIGMLSEWHQAGWILLN